MNRIHSEGINLSAIGTEDTCLGQVGSNLMTKLVNSTVLGQLSIDVLSNYEASGGLCVPATVKALF